MHPAGHQTKLAAHYVLVASDGERIGMMFEKGPSSPTNLWMRAEHAVRLRHVDVLRRDYPATDLYAGADDKGRAIYGRHAALKPMRDLANADLVRFEFERIDQFEAALRAQSSGC
jgi:hypothetical protein